MGDGLLNLQVKVGHEKLNRIDRIVYGIKILLKSIQSLCHTLSVVCLKVVGQELGIPGQKFIA